MSKTDGKRPQAYTFADWFVPPLVVPIILMLGLWLISAITR